MLKKFKFLNRLLFYKIQKTIFKNYFSVLFSKIVMKMALRYIYLFIFHYKQKKIGISLSFYFISLGPYDQLKNPNL